MRCALPGYIRSRSCSFARGRLPACCVFARQLPTMYFKALPASGAMEARLTRFLAQRFPDVVPQVVAAEPARRWLLMTACRGRKLEQIADIAVWERAANRYARLQVACIDHVPALKALGCPMRDLGQLALSIESLAADAALLPRPGGLTQAEHSRFVALAPELLRRCDELAACGIPYSLEHGDFWPGNVFCDDTSCAFIDWEDAVVSHPFFSLAPLTVGLMNAGLGSSENVARVERAYMSAFVPLAPPDRLRRAIELAMPLCFFDMAARYRRQRPSIVRVASVDARPGAADGAARAVAAHLRSAIRAFSESRRRRPTPCVAASRRTLLLSKRR